MSHDLIPQPTAPLNFDLLLSSGAIEPAPPKRSFWHELFAFLMASTPWSDA